LSEVLFVSQKKAVQQYHSLLIAVEMKYKTQTITMTNVLWK